IPRQGVSVASFLTSPRSTRLRVIKEIFCTENTWMKKRAYRNNDYKYIEAMEPDLHGKPPRELYDLRSDPGEQVNLVTVRPEIVQELSGRIHQGIERRKAKSGKLDPMEGQPITLPRVGNPDTPVVKRAGAPP